MKVGIGILMLLSLEAFAQSCYTYHKYNSPTLQNNFRNDHQSKSFHLEVKGRSTISVIAYRGMEYNYKLISDKGLGEKVSFQVYDARTGKVIFDSGFLGYKRTFNFKCNETTRLKVDVKSEDKNAVAGCAGVVIEYKRQG